MTVSTCNYRYSRVTRMFNDDVVGWQEWNEMHHLRVMGTCTQPDLYILVCLCFMSSE